MSGLPRLPSNPLRILHVAMELSPWATAGDVAPFIAGLAAAQQQAGEQVTVVVPEHACCPWPRVFATRVQGGNGVLRLGSDEVPFELRRLRHPAGFEAILVRSSVFDRSGIYLHPDTGEEWEDGLLRASVLCHAALYYALNAGGRWRVIHAHDWHGALTLALLERCYHPTPLQHARGVLTLHDPAFAGTYPLSNASMSGLAASDLVPGGALDCDGEFSTLLAGVRHAHRIHAVSPTHAQELLHDSRPGVLWDAIRSRRDDLVGVLGGLDLAEWDPSRDVALSSSFSAQAPASRELCREDFINLASLDPDLLTIGFAGPLLPEKGLDLLAAVIPELVAEGFQFAIAGSGTGPLQDTFKALARTYPEQVWVTIDGSVELRRRVLAGLDIYCLPSRFEPSALGAMEACRYGSLPLVRRTGGLQDVVPDDVGFHFLEDSPEALAAAIRDAGDRLSRPEEDQHRRRQAMQFERSWAQAAQELRQGVYR